MGGIIIWRKVIFVKDIDKLRELLKSFNIEYKNEHKQIPFIEPDLADETIMFRNDSGETIVFSFDGITGKYIEFDVYE
jgi:hypothetical protein